MSELQWGMFALMWVGAGLAMLGVWQAEKFYKGAQAEVRACADVLQRANAEMDRLRDDARIGRVVWRFIDRMEDVCEQDPADKILAEFVDAVDPAIDAAMQRWFDAGMEAKEAEQ